MNLSEKSNKKIEIIVPVAKKNLIKIGTFYFTVCRKVFRGVFREL
jgi:hypothetical protein